MSKRFANKEIIIGGVSAKQRLLLVEQLHAGVKAGYSITDTLQLAFSQSKGRIRQVLEDVISLVDDGAYLFEAFGKYPKYFSVFFLNLVKTGELSGSLEENLDELHTMLKKEAELKQKLRSAMTYPTFVFVAIVGLGLSVSFFVLPNLLPLFQSLDTELPKTTQLLLWIAQGFEKYGSEIFWGFVFLTFFMIWFWRRKFSQPLTHWLTLNFPVFGKLHRKVILVRFSRTMNSLLKSGVTIDESLVLVSDLLGNYYYSRSLKSVIPLIAKGETLSESLRDYPEIYEDLFVQMLAIGENTGSFEDSFSNIADYYDRQVDTVIKDLMISLEPALLIFVGLIVGFVAISILGPIYSISGSIGR